MKSVKHLKISRKAYLIKMLPKSMESHPVQFWHGSKIKRSISKLWKTIFPAKKRKLRENDFEKLDNVVFRWFFSKQSQNIPIDDNLIKEKAITYAKELGYNNFHGSAGWLDRWKKVKWLTKVFIWRYKDVSLCMLQDIQT